MGLTLHGSAQAERRKLEEERRAEQEARELVKISEPEAQIFRPTTVSDQDMQLLTQQSESHCDV